MSGPRIDAHAHVWPDAIASKALQAAGLDMPAVGDGTLAGLQSALAGAGIDKAVCLGVASEPDKLEAANRFAGTLNKEEGAIGFGSVHAKVGVEESILSLRRHGLKGAKLHPLFQGYRLDDRNLFAILDAMRDEFVVVAHVGSGTTAEARNRCTPPMLKKLIRQLPGLRLVACHFGGYRELEQAAELIVGEDVYLDTSWPPSLAVLDPGRVRELVLRHGPEKVVFASDWPMADPSAEVRSIENLGLGAAATNAILGENFAALLADGPPS